MPYYNIRHPNGSLMLGKSVTTRKEAEKWLRSYTRKYGYNYDKPWPNGKGVYAGTLGWRVVETSRLQTF